jgi:hypothetical protein
MDRRRVPGPGGDGKRSGSARLTWRRRRPARREAAATLAISNSCPVRAECLALSLQHWDIGRHGIWGGLVAAQRIKLHDRMAPGH